MKAELTSAAKMVEFFKLYLQSRKLRPATLMNYHFSLQHFLAYFGIDRDLSTLEDFEIDNYRASLVNKDLADRTINTYLINLENFLKWGVRKKFLDEAPAVEKVVEAPFVKKPIFKPGEYSVLLRAADKECSPVLAARARAVVMLLNTTGLRASELVNAYFTDIFHENINGEDYHFIRIQGAKRSGIRDVPFPEECWQAILEYRKELAQPHGRSRKKKGLNPETIFTSTKDFEKPLTVSGLRRLLFRLEQQTSIRCNPHKFRRGFATHWLNKDGSEREVEALMIVGGWKDRETLLNHYAHVHRATIAQAARRNAPRAR